MYVQLTLNDEDGVPEVYSTPPWTDDADGGPRRPGSSSIPSADRMASGLGSC